MRKFCTFLLTAMVALVANAATTQIKATVSPSFGEALTSASGLDGKIVAIYNQTDEKALYGSSMQVLNYEAYSDAFSTSNSGYQWKLVSLAENADESVRGYYLLRLITPSGGEYTFAWGEGYLNSQPSDGNCCFILGLKGTQLGQDFAKGAVWDIQYEEGKGFALKNVGTGGYFSNPNASCVSETPVYFDFAPVTISSSYVPALKELLAEGEAMKANGASSAEYDEVVAAINPDAIEGDGLTECQAVEAALVQLCKSQKADGSDFTRAIVNPFIDGADGWTTERPVGGNGPLLNGNSFEYWAGNASDRENASFDYWQEITGLPNGTYKLGADMLNDTDNENGASFAESCGLYATAGETTVSAYVTENGRSLKPYETSEIEVTDGTLRIGVKNLEDKMAARWFAADNFTLTLVKAVKVPTYADLARDMYHQWTGYEADAEIASPDNPGGGVILNQETDCPYGNTNVGGGEYADLTEWDYLTLAVTSGFPRLFFNDSSTDGGRLTVATANASTDPYVEDKGDGVFVVDLAAIKAVRGFVHLNAIKAASWDTKATVSEMKLATVEAYIPAPKYDITVLVCENGSVSVQGDLTKAAEGEEITLIATPDAEFELDAFAVSYVDNEVPQEVTVNEGKFTMPAFPVSVSATFKAASASVPEEDAWFTENTFCYKDAANSVSRSMELPWVADPDDASNGCIQLSSAANAGNDHDLQFMIRGAEYDGSNLMNGAFAEGTGFKVTFKVKADGNYSGCLVGTFNSIAAEGKDGWKFGNYLENQAVKMDVTTEWQTVSYSYFATADDAGKFTAIGFNLAEKGGAARTFYFDDVQIEQGSEWSLATTITDKWKENGQDKNKPATFKTENGESFVEIVTTSNANTWDNQVFFQIADASPSGKLKKNDKITLQFQAMATLDAESTLTNTEIQAGGGFHKSYDGAGWLASTDGATIKVGDWAEVTREITINRDDITNFSLDLSYDSKPITYRFKDVKVTYESGVESWTETMAYRLKVTPFTWDADAEKWNKEADTNEAPTYDLGTGGEEGGYYQVEAAPKHDNTYETQFFFQIADLAPTKVLKNNETVTLKFKIKAISENLEAGTEIQCGGGFHKSYDGAGWLSGAPSSTCVVGQWTTIEQTFEIGNADITCYSIDLSQDTEAPITYQIDEVEGTWTEAPVLDWVPLIAGGDCEATPEHVFVVAKESPIDAEEVHQGRIVEGVGVDGSYGIEIVAGDKVSQPWDNQFWIYEPYSLPSGTKFTVEFDYRAKEAATASSQIHLAPSAYQYWNAVGNVNFTTEWQHFKYEGKVSNGDNNAIINLRALAFNISEKAEANTYYIDNVSFKVPAGTIDGIEPVYVDDYPTATYTDPSTLTYTDNILVNGDLEGEDMNEFVGKIVKGDYIYDGDGLPTDEYVYEDLDPETLTLEAEEYVESWEQEQAGEAGPNGLVISVAEWPEGQGNDYDSQLWVRLPKALPKGTAFKLSFDYAGSNSATSVAMAAHAEPGQWQTNFSKTIKPADDFAWTHFEEYMTAPEDMRSIAFNLGSKNGGVYFFDNFSVQYDAAKATDVEELTATWDMNWAETLALNEKIHEAKGYDNEEGQYTEESFSALQTAITDAKTVAKNAEAAKDDIVAATSDVQDAIDGLEAPEELLPAPETDPDYADFELIPFAQEDQESGDVHLAPMTDKGAYTQFTTTAGICVVFKMKNIDVSDCDYITIKFAKPAPAGQSYAVWTGTTNQSVPTGASEIKYVFADDTNCKVQNGILPEVSIISIFTAGGADVSVYGVYKHKAGAATAIAEIAEGAALKDGKYFVDGQTIIVKNGKKYTVAGVEIK